MAEDLKAQAAARIQAAVTELNAAMRVAAMDHLVTTKLDVIDTSSMRANFPTVSARVFAEIVG